MDQSWFTGMCSCVFFDVFSYSNTFLKEFCLSIPFYFILANHYIDVARHSDELPGNENTASSWIVTLSFHEKNSDNHTGKDARGGINTFYAATKPYYTSKTEFITRGSRNYPYRGNVFNQATRLLVDYGRFIHKLVVFNPTIIHVNLTLDKRGLFRDRYLHHFVLPEKKKQIIGIFSRMGQWTCGFI